jgi:hypothetical protein
VFLKPDRKKRRVGGRLVNRGSRDDWSSRIDHVGSRSGMFDCGCVRRSIAGKVWSGHDNGSGTGRRRNDWCSHSDCAGRWNGMLDCSCITGHDVESARDGCEVNSRSLNSFGSRSNCCNSRSGLLRCIGRRRTGSGASHNGFNSGDGAKVRPEVVLSSSGLSVKNKELLDAVVATAGESSRAVCLATLCVRGVTW